MYIPAKSGHVSHTIKNYVLGELKRYIRYNSLKLTFLKIRTKFFSRLRNRGFKKVWLRKHFATLKYEDREKLMAIKDSDSSSSHPEFQMVLEREAECLKTLRSRLADKFPYQTDSNQDIDGNKTLFKNYNANLVISKYLKSLLRKKSEYQQRQQQHQSQQQQPYKKHHFQKKQG